MKAKKIKCITFIVAALILSPAIPLSVNSLGQSQQQTVPEGWKSLFDGKTLKGWEIVSYGSKAEPHVKNGVIVLPKADVALMTGICWVGDSIPVENYTIYYEARRTAGDDIFAGLTFPYQDSHASLIFGGWGGMVNGLSSIDGNDASGNETSVHFRWGNDKWYPVELYVTTDSIKAFVGDNQIVDVATYGKRIHLRDDGVNEGLNLWTYASSGEVRNLRIKKLP